VTPGGRLFVKRGGVDGITTVQVVTVEFTGSNWQVFHGSANSSNDTGNITITTSGSGVEANGAYEFACLSNSPYYFYYLDSTNLSGENKAGSYDGAANVGGTLVGSGLIDEFDDALEGSSFSITTSNADEINAKSNHAAKTLEAIIRIDDTNTLQCIYEQGGGTRGFSLSIDSGYLYFSGWNNSTSDGPGDDWGANSSRSHVYASVAIPSTGTYYIAGVYVQESSDDTFDGELRVYLGDVTDSTSLTSFINDTDDIGKQYAHTGDALWCQNSDGFIGSSGVNTSPSNFDGAINAIALYDVEVTDTQIRSHFDAIFDEDFTPVDTTGVISWDKAFIFGNTIDVSGSEGLAHQAVIYNEGSTTDSSDTKYVNWEFNANHGSTNDHFVHVLCHNDMVVTRFSDTSSAAGANNVNVSSASLSDLEQAMVVGYVTTSGTGDALARGWRNYRLTSLTNVEHWCHRSGNTMRHEIQVIDLSGIEDTAIEQYHTKIITMII